MSDYTQQRYKCISGLHCHNYTYIRRHDHTYIHCHDYISIFNHEEWKVSFQINFLGMDRWILASILLTRLHSQCYGIVKFWCNSQFYLQFVSKIHATGVVYQETHRQKSLTFLRNSIHTRVYLSLRKLSSYKHTKVHNAQTSILG